MTLEFVAIAMSSLALLISTAITLWLVIDYRASRDAGEIIEKQGEALAQYVPKFPRRPR